MTTNIGGTGALAVVFVPPILGAAIGAYAVSKHRVLGGVGGFIAGIAATQIYAHIVQAQSQAQLQQSTAATSTSWEPGRSYMFETRVPPGVTTQDQLASTLQSAGWVNITINWFGPTQTTNSAAPPISPWGGDPGLYVATGTWNGPANTPIPQWVMSRNL
jgi:hypothetical protein